MAIGSFLSTKSSSIADTAPMDTEMDDNYFDSEKAFHEAVDESRRGFLKKIGTIVAGAVALDVAPKKLPDPPPAVPEDIHIRSVGIDANNYGDPVYSTTQVCMTSSMPMQYTCLPSYAFDERAWFPVEHARGKSRDELIQEYWRKIDALRKTG